MTERFVVIPVGQGDSGSREEEVDNDHVTLPDDGGGEGAGGDFVDNQGGVIPILEYSREPNKYGKTNCLRQKFENFRTTFCKPVFAFICCAVLTL